MKRVPQEERNAVRRAGGEKPRATDKLHRAVYRAMIGLAIIFAVSAWLFFGKHGYSRLDLTMVSVLFTMAIGVPLILSRVGRNDPSRPAQKERAASDVPAEEGALTDWLRRDFEDWQSREKARNAAIEILLPLTAGAVGMTAIGLVYFIMIHTGALA
jgi:hypothetical protein